MKRFAHHGWEWMIFGVIILGYFGYHLFLSSKQPKAKLQYGAQLFNTPHTLDAGMLSNISNAVGAVSRQPWPSYKDAHTPTKPFGSVNPPSNLQGKK